MTSPLSADEVLRLGELASAPVHFISAGIGVQTVTLLHMANDGYIKPLPKAGIFGDTTDEKLKTYKHRDEMLMYLKYPLLTVSIGSLSMAITSPRISKKTGNGYIKPSIPAFFKGEGLKLARGRGQRHCTQDFKIEPVKRAANLMRGGRPVVMWIGISTDEQLRAKPSTTVWITNRFPLIEMGMSRQDCIKWLIDHGYAVPPSSSCVYCPFHSDDEWMLLKRDDPDGFTKAARVEKEYQIAAQSAFDRVPYFHASCIPLDQVKFEKGKQLDMFTNECEGMCGV